MAAVIRFTTSLFDVSKERPNSINPIPGESLLLWLAKQAEGTVSIGPPDTEDWGWFSDLSWGGRAYMLGACAYDDEGGDGRREWVLQIDKHRTLKERVLGAEKMTEDDPCVRFVHQLLEQEPAFEDISFDEPSA